jgi:hypothetical protein
MSQTFRRQRSIIRRRVRRRLRRILTPLEKSEKVIRCIKLSEGQNPVLQIHLNYDKLKIKIDA